MNTLIPLIGLLAAAAACVAQPKAHPNHAKVTTVSPAAETTPVPSGDDAADDPAIWVHPTDPARSLVIGTDKISGLALYDLAGEQVQFLRCGRVNNVDVRRADDGSGIVVATNRSNDSVLILRLDPDTLQLTVRRTIDTDLREIYGLAAARTEASHGFDLHIVAGDKSGEVIHWVWRNAASATAPRVARRFHVGGQPEGMVADEAHGILYIGEENAGIWAYPLDPDADAERTLVDAVLPVGQHLTADVEGLTIAGGPDGEGWLLASSQGSDRFVAYDRRTLEHAFTFSINASGSVDGVTGTDGIDATATPLGDRFPGGLLVVQDGDNGPDNQNFKLLHWSDVLRAAGFPSR